MHQPLLKKNECYICLEACTNDSPCECRAKVHKKCIHDFYKHNKSNRCTICHREFNEPIMGRCEQCKSCCERFVYNCCLWLAITFANLVIFLMCGYIGEFILQSIGVLPPPPSRYDWRRVDVYDDTYIVRHVGSVDFIASAFLMIMVLFVILRASVCLFCRRPYIYEEHLV